MKVIDESDLHTEALMLQARGFSPSAISMLFGAVGTDEYYEAMKRYGGDVSGKCPNCGERCFGTGDCNCHED